MARYRASPFSFATGPVPPVIKGLLVVTIGVYLFTFFLELLFRDLTLIRLFALRPAAALTGLQLWQLVTYAYLHDLHNPFHILFNMLFLWLFGCELAALMGARRFLVFYHFCALMGGLAQALVQLGVGRPEVTILGASGAIYGVFTVYALLFPDREILFLLLFPMKIKYFVLILVGIDFLSGTRFLGTGAAHFCHLGGAAAGLLFHHGADRVAFTWAAWRRRLERRRARRREEVRRAVDALLEKIRREGMQALTERERRFLRAASKLYQEEDNR